MEVGLLRQQQCHPQHHGIWAQGQQSLLKVAKLLTRKHQVWLSGVGFFVPY
jgi:hypothetical protein